MEYRNRWKMIAYVKASTIASFKIYGYNFKHSHNFAGLIVI